MYYLVKDKYRNYTLSICRLTLGLKGDLTYNYHYDMYRERHGWLTLPFRPELAPEEYFHEYSYEIVSKSEDYDTLEYMKELVA